MGPVPAPCAAGLEHITVRMLSRFEPFCGREVPGPFFSNTEGHHGYTVGQSLPCVRPPGPAGVSAPLPLPGAAQLLISLVSPPIILLYP